MLVQPVFRMNGDVEPHRLFTPNPELAEFTVVYHLPVPRGQRDVLIEAA